MYLIFAALCSLLSALHFALCTGLDSAQVGALQAGDTRAVFLLQEPDKIPRHNIYELVWFLKTGLTRMGRMMLGLEPFQAGKNISTSQNVLTGACSNN